MNKTFHPNNFNFHACVGINGNPDIEAYAYGYAECVKILAKSAVKGETSLDTIVYPIAYSARHYIELTLKHQLSLLSIMNQIVDSTYNYEVMSIHEISKLWDDFKLLASFDKRYCELIQNADNYIIDFSEIDNNGEAFRYPYSNDNYKHLSEIYHIDVNDLTIRFNELFAILGEITLLTDQLIDEYKQRSIVGKVSRDEIEAIARQLPPIEKWSENGFDEIKAKIKIDYSLTSNQLSKIITFIKSHREFSSLINKEIMIEELSGADLKWFLKTYDNFRKNRESCDSYFDYLKGTVRLINRKLNKRSIASLAHLYDMGYFSLYSEEYDKGLLYMMKKSKSEIIRVYLLRNGIVRENIERGLKSMGQKTLLKEFYE